MKLLYVVIFVYWVEKINHKNKLFKNHQVSHSNFNQDQNLYI